MNKSGKNLKKPVDELRLKLLRQPLYGRSIEYVDNRISLYSAQKGLCAVSGEKFTSTDQIHCHHKIPKSQGGTDEFHLKLHLRITAPHHANPVVNEMHMRLGQQLTEGCLVGPLVYMDEEMRLLRQTRDEALEMGRVGIGGDEEGNFHRWWMFRMRLHQTRALV